MRLSKFKAALAGVLLALSGAALAQVVPGRNYSSTIAVTNAFQEIFVGANQSLNNCSIQNTSTHVMYVYFVRPAASPADTPSIAKAATLAIGQALYCGDSTTALVNSPWITGTSGDTFYAERW